MPGTIVADESSANPQVVAVLTGSLFILPYERSDMSRRPSEESRIDGDFSVTLPPEVRDRVEVDPGDRLRWRVEDDGTISVEVVGGRHGAFGDLDPVDTGEVTDATADHDTLAGNE